ncbi:hypothetical protein chiPu_0018188, partial [Chiloscyllium punctatum]|nr:hypothetical protein [Chiloscyllium punctatum]
FEMEHTAPHQTTSSYNSPYSRRFALLFPESPLHLVPDVETSGLEWFDVQVSEVMEPVDNRDRDVPSSPSNNTIEKMLNSQDTDFVVPSTPIDPKLEKVVTASAHQTCVRKPSPQGKSDTNCALVREEVFEE